MSAILVVVVVVVAYAVASDSARVSFGPTAINANINVEPALNLRPIIGVLTQPGDFAKEGQSMVAASYVKWIEAAGARVVPVLYDMSTDELKHVFSIINGLVIPGGGAALRPGNPFYDTAALLLDMVIDANDKGEYFPLHGTCLGLELLATAAAKNYTLLESFDAENDPTPLLYTAEAAGSHLLSSLPGYVVETMRDEPITMENHGKGVSMKAYEENVALKEFFKVLSLSEDRRGSAYVSTLEAWRYPITATQWHPEKNIFEWTPHLQIPHTPHAVELGQEMANFVASEARRNSRHAADQVEEDALLIYNWSPVFTGKHATPTEKHSFEQVYIFDAKRHPLRQR